jgi:competence protein ComEA
MHPLVLSPRRVLLGGLLLVAVLLVGGRFLLRTGTAAVTAPPIVGSATASPGSATADVVGGGPGPPSTRLVVYVVGAVRRPGLYRLPSGARVADAVARAGGTTRKADPTALNLAAPVADGEQVLVPAVLPRAVAAAQGAPVAGAPVGPVQLSVATAEQLDTLPGIGPVTAQKIVDWRTAHGAFHSVDDLDQVPGIGPARVEQLRGLVVP